MRRLMVASLLLANVSLACAAAETDLTSGVLKSIQAKGLREARLVEMNGVKMHLMVAAGADEILSKRAFDIQDDAFDEARYFDFIGQRFSKSVESFGKILGKSPIKEFYVVVDDLGADRKTTLSQAWPSTRVIQVDVRRWHKLHRGLRSYLADLTSIHEFTHINNYFLKPAEVKRHRELIAVMFEAINIVKNEGASAFSDRYLKNVGVASSSCGELKSEAYSGMAALRNLAHSFITKVLRGFYDVAGDRTSALERFAGGYLSDPEVGSLGFNRALEAVGIRSSDNARLTLERIQNDLCSKK